MLVREMEPADWGALSDEALLERRISTLGLKLEGAAIQPLIRQLYDELSAKGLVFHPPCHIGDEWFVPIGIPAIFIPFFLVHDRLRALERTMMLEVEGGTKEWFMKLMRHEAGHAYTYAYQLTRKKKWRQIFGPTSREETPDTYRPRRSAAVTSCISKIGTLRAIRMKISRRLSRSGSRRDLTGANVTLDGGRSKNSNTSMN